MPFAPVLRRRFLEPAWSRYTGASLSASWRDLEASQWLSHGDLLERQLRLARELVGFVDQHNGFYHDRFAAAGINPRALGSLDELRRIPILTKADVRAHGKDMLSRGFERQHLMTAKTGGSTGKPIQLWFTEEVSHHRNAAARRTRRWAGWEVGEPIGAVWGNPNYPETLRERLREWVLSPVIYLDTMSITADAVRRFSAEWTRARPSLLFGHAHSIFLLASMVKTLGVTGIRPRAIIASSMMLPAHERALIESVFGVKVTDAYGCEEVGLIAGECERHEGLHLTAEQLIVEVLGPDGSTAAPGEPGLVVVTDLLNTAMPFIRYRMEDMAEISERPCSCGRGLPTLQRVVGRTADFLRRTDGSRVAGISLIENTLTRMPGIEQMQIVQDTLRHIALRVVAGPDFPSHREDLLEYFRKTFPGTVVELEEVPAILPEPNGKYRFSICRVDG